MKSLLEFQTVHAALADILVQVEAAPLLIHRAAAGAGRGAPDPGHTSIARCFANEMAKKVSDMAIRLHCHYGYSVEYGIERRHRDSHGWAIAGRTTTIQPVRIASEYLGRHFDQCR